ncbi:hypothetical protein IFM89_023628 [Coptis chinensis]|uniref:Uncharacterized protein n=1 Tax=Coptis chinensis TaxID=261450 RepID=A0A835HPK6_9MAGN|nr:hypothetical protein IFM89_023628 [Coptis chinensis]
MGDRKNLKIHYAGSFSKRRNGEELSHLDYRSKYPVKEMLDVDSDELNMIDFAADVSLPSHMSKLDYINIKLFYLVSGKQVYVNSDSGLLGMFDLLVVDDEGYCHVFVENDMDESAVPPSQEYDETMCTLMDLKKLIKKRALNANDKGNSMQKKKKSDKDKGEAKGKKKSTTHMKGKGVLVDGEDSFWVELSKFSNEEMDTELPEYVDVPGLATNDPVEIDVEVGFRNPPRQPRLIAFDPDEGYHKDKLIDEEIEWQQPRSDEFYNFVYETSNVYVDEGEIVMPTCSDEWKVGMEWPDIETLRHEISDYCIKNRFEVDMRTVNERRAVLYPRRVYWKEYCSSYYWVSTYKLAYMGHIMPMPDMSEWPMNCDLERQIMPPPYVRGIGRPKKARTRGADEEVNPNKQIRLCSKCKQPEHNAKTCKGLPAAKKDKHGKKSQEETQASACSDEALESIKHHKHHLLLKHHHQKQRKRKDKHGKNLKRKLKHHKLQTNQASKAKSATKSTIGDSKIKFSSISGFIETPQSTKFRQLDFWTTKSKKIKTAQAQVLSGRANIYHFGNRRAPIVTKRPRPHGPGSTPFMPAGPASQPWVPPRRVGDAPFKATKKILPPLAPGPLPTSRKKFQVVRPK